MYLFVISFVVQFISRFIIRFVLICFILFSICFVCWNIHSVNRFVFVTFHFIQWNSISFIVLEVISTTVCLLYISLPGSAVCLSHNFIVYHMLIVLPVEVVKDTLIKTPPGVNWGGGGVLRAAAPPKPQLRLILSYNKSKFNQHFIKGSVLHQYLWKNCTGWASLLLNLDLSV